MRRAFIALALLAACSTISLRPSQVRADDPATTQSIDAPVLVSVSDKAAITAAIDKEVFLEGTIEEAAWSASGKVMKASFKSDGNSGLSVILFEKKKADFDTAYGGDITKALTGARVRIAGKLKDFKGKPEVVLDKVSQITILDAAPATQPATQPAK